MLENTRKTSLVEQWKHFFLLLLLPSSSFSLPSLLVTIFFRFLLSFLALAEWSMWGGGLVFLFFLFYLYLACNFQNGIKCTSIKPSLVMYLISTLEDFLLSFSPCSWPAILALECPHKASLRSLVTSQLKGS